MADTRRSIIVTGSNGGIGRASCIALQNAGFLVLGTDITESSAHDIPYFRCDLSDPEDVRKAFEDTLASHGPIYGLVNNASHYHRKSFFEIGYEDMMMTFHVNIVASFVASQILARSMIANGGGVIVNVGSLAGHIGSLTTDYGITKAGLFAMTKGLAKTLGPKGIRVNAVAPSLVNTAQYNPANPMAQAILAKNPIPRVAEPGEIANVIAFLASDQASYVNGAVYDVNGGAH